MISKIFTLALICVASLSYAQESMKLTPEQEKQFLQFKKVDSLQKLFKDEPSLRKKIVLYDSLRIAVVGGKFHRELAWFESDIATMFATDNQVEDALTWIEKIKIDYIQRDAIISTALEFSKAGNKAQGLKLLRPYLDQLLNADRQLKEKEIPHYADLVTAYIQILDPEEKEQTVYYLKPLYEGSGKAFKSDLTSRAKRPDLDFRHQLFYRYAKALPGNKTNEIAAVICSAFETGAVPKTMQKEVIAAFPEIPGLDQQIAKLAAATKLAFKSRINQLIAKKDIDGKSRADELKQAKYILVDFWGSWCLPCRATHPHLRELYAKYKDNGFEILGVAHETAKDLEIAKKNWKKAVADDQIEWIHVLNNEGMDKFNVVNEFKIASFPTKIIITPDGVEVARFEAGSTAALDKKLKELFGG